MAQVDHLELVKSLYAAFDRGDVPSIVAALAPNVDWRINVDPKQPGADHPLFRPCNKPAEVPRFFEALMTSFEPCGMTSRGMARTLDGKGVLALFTEQYRVRRKGRELAVDTVHHWTFDDQGRVVAWRGYTDTAVELAAAREGTR